MQPALKLYSISEAAQILGISAETLRRWERSGKIKVGRTPTGNRVFSQQDIENLRNGFGVARGPVPLRPEGSRSSLTAAPNELRADREPSRAPLLGSTKAPRVLPNFRNLNYRILAMLVITFASLAVAFYTLSAFTPYPRQAVLGVETFIAPVIAEEGPLSSFFQNAGRTILSLGSIFKNNPIYSFVVPLVQRFEEPILSDNLNVKGKGTFAKDIEGLGNLKIKGTAFVGKLVTGIVDPYLIENDGSVQSTLEIRSTGDISLEPGTSGSGNVTLGGNNITGVNTLTASNLNSTNLTTNTLTIEGSISTPKITTTSDATIGGNITLSGVINSNTLTDTKLVFAGSSPSIYAGTTNTGISLNANGTGAISIGNSSTGDIYIGGGTTSGTYCLITNSSGSINCPGTATFGGALNVTGASTLSLTLNVTGATTLSSTLSVSGASTLTGAVTAGSTLGVTGTTSLNGAVNLGDATSDDIAVNGRLTTSVLPKTTGSVDLGSSSLKFNNLYSNTINTAAINTSGQGVFNLNPASVAITDASLLINPTTVTNAGSALLGVAVAGVEKARLDETGKLTVQGSYAVGAASGQTLGACGASQYLGGVAVTGGIISALGSCTTVSSSWSGLTAPTGNLSLAMAGDTTTFTYGNATGASTNLFNLTDTASNTGTGYLMDISTAALSNLKPFTVTARGNAIIDTDSLGLLTLGNTTANQNVQFFSGSNNITPAGALTVASTINAGGAITAPTTVNTINGAIISSGNITVQNLTINGSVQGNITATGTVTGTQLISSVSTGTAPLSVTSTTVVPNLNVSQLQGYVASDLYSQPQPNLVLNSDFGRRNKWMTFMPETFTDTSGTAPLGWTASMGLLGTVNGAGILTGGNAAGNWGAVAGLSTWRDARFSAQFKAVDTANVQYDVEKYADANNYVKAGWDNSGVFLLTKVIGGAATGIATSAQSLTLNNWYWIELEAQGTTYIAKLYSSGASPVAKSSATLVVTLSGTVSDAAVTTGQIAITRVSGATAPQWGGLSTGDGGVYVEGWGPESWTVAFASTKGGQAFGFDETFADGGSGPLGKQWSINTYIPATNRELLITQNNDWIGGFADSVSNASLISPNTTYAASYYYKVSGLGGSGTMVQAAVTSLKHDGTQVAQTLINDSADASWTQKTGTLASGALAIGYAWRFDINAGGARTGTAYVLLPQLEKGSVVTPWRNARSDDDPIVWNTQMNNASINPWVTGATEIDSRDLAGNLFFPWDANIRVDLNVQAAIPTGDNLYIYTYLDGNNRTAAGGIPQENWLTAASSDVYGVVDYTGIKSIAAGKHRIAAMYNDRLAGNGTIYGSNYGANGYGTAMIVTATRGKFDLAEEYSVNDPTIGAGDVVQLTSNNLQFTNNTTIERSNKGYNSSVLGIVSTAPGITLSSTVELNSYQQKPNLRPVALSGRVPVKVTNENGDIHRGDTLTSSALYPGYAMKATKAGPSIGIAMDDFAPAPQENNPIIPISNIQFGKIMTFVNLSWYDPDVYLTDSGQFVISNNQSQISNNPIVLSSNGLVATQSATPEPSYQLTNTQTKETIEKTGAFNNLFVANLKVGSLDASELRINNEELKMTIASLSARIKNLEIGTQSAVLSASISGLLNEQTATNSGILSSLTVSGRTVLNDLGITGNISAGLLSIDGLNSSINSLGGIDFKVPGGQVLIDKDGNLLVQKLNVSSNSLGKGTLPAGQLNVIIQTASVASGSAVFVTPETVISVPLAVTQKTAEQSFKVEVPSPLNTDVIFDWWVVN